MRKQHADRNKALCEKLFGEGVYYDWVITTAFYSAIHYCEHKLFPMDVTPTGRPWNTLNDAHMALKTKSPHEARKRLVTSHLTSILTPYNFLEVRSKVSRYNNYNVTPAQANQAKRMLELIVNACV